MNQKNKSMFMLGESGHDRYGDNTPYHRLGGLFYMSPYWYDRDKHKGSSKGTYRTKRKQKRSR